MKLPEPSDREFWTITTITITLAGLAIVLDAPMWIGWVLSLPLAWGTVWAVARWAARNTDEKGPTNEL
jgi:hypothetical protein